MSIGSQLDAVVKAIAALPGIVRGINLSVDLLHTIIQNQERIMSELDDLNAAIAALTTSVTAGTSELKALADKIVALLGAPGGVDPAAVEAAANQIKSVAASIDQGVAAAKAEAGV